jgi:hypothetical protein
MLDKFMSKKKKKTLSKYITGFHKMKPKFKTTTMTSTFTLAHLPKRHCRCRRLATCHTHHKTQAVVVAVEAL